MRLTSTHKAPIFVYLIAIAMTDEFFTSKPEVDHIYEVMHIKLYLYFSFFIVEYFHFLPEPILLMQLLGQTYVS